MTFEIRAGNGFAAQLLRTASVLTAELRDGAAARLTKALLDRADEIARLVDGRGASPLDRDRRIRLIPLASIGHAETSPSIRRVLVDMPADNPLRPADVAWALGGLHGHDADGEIRWELARSDDDAMAGRHIGPARRWRSITALALPASTRRRIAHGGADAKGGAEREAEHRAAAALVQALRHASILTTPHAVRMQREPFDRRGARAEDFAAGARFAKHAMWHADVHFSCDVSGPLLLGDGRFAGLGLMRPVEQAPGVQAVRLVSALPDRANSLALAAAFRAALMARWRQETGSFALPRFVSGHEANGAPARSGGRDHVACFADIAGGRLIVIAPHPLARRDPTRDERAHLKTLSAVMERFERIAAGPSGLLSVTPELVETGDPLLASARAWESLTPWRPLRHRKTGDTGSDIHEDACAEHRLRRLPEPSEITVIEADQGRKGGIIARLRLRLRLRYAVAVAGPLLLRRTAQKGGGAFVAVD
ncbi:MAG: CRISPR-associated protein Csb2 [Paracoccaceae bacterium]|jgi:CRISPR-associated protein Csb2